MLIPVLRIGYKQAITPPLCAVRTGILAVARNQPFRACADGHL
ncbi:hypothetical protein TRIP_B10021 [uncultured Desulfatiglans sp.]|nr:hypothetical protein TRIP_B10021 [uncultured Desulfatiglans sp.]